MFTQSVELRCDEQGAPSAVLWQGRTWKVCAEPVRWFERRAWWNEDPRAVKGSGPGVIDHLIWQLQVQLNPRSEPQTMYVSQHCETGRWRLINVELPSQPLRRSA